MLPREGGVVVRTEAGEYGADHVVVALGNGAGVCGSNRAISSPSHHCWGEPMGKEDRILTQETQYQNLC